MTFTLNSRTDLPVTLDALPVAELAPGPDLRIVGELRDYGETWPLRAGRMVAQGFEAGVGQVRPRWIDCDAASLDGPLIR